MSIQGYCRHIDDIQDMIATCSCVKVEVTVSKEPRDVERQDLIRYL